jgi:hypothetical protein
MESREEARWEAKVRLKPFKWKEGKMVSDIGMLKCHNKGCISNTAKEDLKALAEPWGLIDEAGRVSYPKLGEMLRIAFGMLRSKGQYVSKNEVVERVKKVQTRIYELRKFVLDMGSSMSKFGFKALCKEVLDPESRIGGSKLCCPFCGSDNITLAWKVHENLPWSRIRFHEAEIAKMERIFGIQITYRENPDCDWRNFIREEVEKDSNDDILDDTE